MIIEEIKKDILKLPKYLKSLFEPWFGVDTRSLGIYRIFLGLLCFIDIARRWNYIEIFYTENSLLSAGTTSSFYKMFTLLSTFTKPWEVYSFFLIGLVFSILCGGLHTKVGRIESSGPLPPESRHR